MMIGNEKSNMRKFIASVVVSIGLMASLTACNKQVIDLNYSYSWAQFKMPDGSIVEGKVDSWTDYEGEQVQVTIDGTTYLVSSINLVMKK